MRTVSEGLPVNWQELSYQDDIIAGAEFLSIFLRSRLQDSQMAIEDRQRTLTTTLETILDSDNDLIEYPKKELLRHSRSTSFLTAPVSQPLTVTPPITEQQFTTVSTAPLQNGERSSERSNSKVSSVFSPANVDKTIDAELPLSTTEMYRAIVSEERPSIFADVNKSEFSVDESEPIAHNANTAQDYPATEAMSDPNAAPLYSSAQGTVNQQNFVYHNYPEDGDRSRSVSYSSVIQELPQQTILSSWNIEKPLGGNYKAVTFDASKTNDYDVDKTATVNMNNTASTTGSYFREVPAEEDQENMMVPLKTSEENSRQQNTAPPKEGNWHLHTNVYPSTRPTSRSPVVYGKPEQNYEVDESVSIMTNGRTHGVQAIKAHDTTNPAIPPLTNNQNAEDNTDPNGQKVGYVVEGRNFRKYRVEERTSDGFIVGEYGVVSHNDGSLRGVRYTADSTINPRVIYDALMKFLSL